MCAPLTVLALVAVRNDRTVVAPSIAVSPVAWLAPAAPELVSFDDKASWLFSGRYCAVVNMRQALSSGWVEDMADSAFCAGRGIRALVAVLRTMGA